MYFGLGLGVLLLREAISKEEMKSECIEGQRLNFGNLIRN